MDRAELLAEFEGRVDKFEKYQGFIEKARSQSGKFAAAVVEKVVTDNTEKSMEVVGEIIPLMADMETVIDELNTEKSTAVENAKDSKFKLEELELRQMIGDLSDEAFEDEAREHKDVVESTESKVGEIEAELEKFHAAIERWNETGTKAGVLDPNAVQAEPEPEPEPELEAEPEPEPELDDEIDFEDDGDIVAEEVDLGGFVDDGKGNGAHVESVSIAEDMSVVFDEGEEDDEGDGFEVGDLDILGDDDELELEAGDAGDIEEEDDKPRRAVLLYQEGTAEEQIYPFTGDVMSLGRGRDNDVQVKNDSKVSRYHCKLYRRGPNFYIEDNKSANGTLVNGELITERRLFGGEEVIIGETFFRFRILD